MNGTSPTAATESEIEDLSDQILIEERSAPVSRVELSSAYDLQSGTYSAFASGVGTVVGFGAGHALQGHYSRDGWKWTAIDSAVYGSFAVMSANCPVQKTADGGREFRSCGDASALWMLSFLALRVWQSVELWGHTVDAFSPYNRAISRNPYVPILSITAHPESQGLLASWSW